MPPVDTTSTSINQLFEKTPDSDSHYFDFIQYEKALMARCKSFLFEELDLEESKYSHPTELCINETSNFGASARILDGIDTLTVNSGTLVFLLWAAMAGASSPKLPFGESESSSVLPHRRPGRSTLDLISHALPADPVKRAFGFEIAYLCVIFVIYHELGHLAQGHCALISAGLFDFGAEDPGPELRGKEANNRRRSLEILADEFAMRALMHRLELSREELKLNGITPTSDQTTQQKALWLVYADQLVSPTIPYIVLSIVFHLTASTSENHPAADKRLLSCMRTCHQLINTNVDNEKLGDSEIISVLRLQIASNMMSIFEEVLLEAIDPQLLHRDAGWKGIERLEASDLERAEEELSVLTTIIRAIEEELRPLARLPRALAKRQ